MSKTSLKDLPSVNKVLHEVSSYISLHESYIKYLINKELDILRVEIKKGTISKSSNELLSKIINNVWMESAPKLINIINGTGIVLHTGFGRAPFNSKVLKEVADRLDGYVNLEFDLSSGKRGDRQVHIREHLSSICESESSLAVNNNAAAVMLSINEIAENGDVIVSRGQLVEIGGSFRIPDIIEKSGANLKEVGTTNRTHISDYKSAITKSTKLILWVHTSNYVIKGFTSSVNLSELVLLGKKYNIPVMVDWGSGAFLDMNSFQLADEIPIKSIMQKSNPHLVTFSGDKLIGGPQSGLIVGKKEFIKRLQKNPLYRVLRCDKITIALLEGTLRSYRSESYTKDNLTLKMLLTSRKVLKNRGEKVLNLVNKRKIKGLGLTLVKSYVVAGSGSLPENKIESMALSFNPQSMKITELASAFRCGSFPVIGYISEKLFYIDLKAILPSQINRLIKAIEEL